MVGAIAKRPSLRNVAWTAIGHSETFPFSSSTATFWHNGRAAIWQGLQSLGLTAGDRVLVPAYACGSEIDALVKAGLTLDFYRLRPDLCADQDHIKKLAQRPFRAIYLTHYFGFPQPASALMALARNQGAFLIEDNALGLYSVDENGWPLGAVGDIGVFSLTKTLPVPDGGVLVIGDADGVGPRLGDSSPPDPIATAGRLKSLIEATIAHHLPRTADFIKNRVTGPLIRLVKPARGERSQSAAGGDVEDGGALDILRATWHMSAASAMILRRVNHRFVADVRRANYQYLHERLESGPNARQLMPKLPRGACPAFFPLWAKEPAEMHQYLRSHGVESVRFWSSVHKAMPLSDFPFERSLKHQVLRLPIHQDLKAESMRRIADLVNAWNCGHS